jgi:hypothetical protein
MNELIGYLIATILKHERYNDIQENWENKNGKEFSFILLINMVRRPYHNSGS